MIGSGTLQQHLLPGCDIQEKNQNLEDLRLVILNILVTIYYGPE